ncbi:Endonuclease-reverse transcriptase [Popillia japonica]|uniref:Endonuclease-reverse transcriptase n=1 Tax=Popillia japonica TaxID=7064 RepID=A0AAW1N4R9_POPJA
MNISATLTVITEKYQNNRILLAGDFNIDFSGNSNERAELINIGNMIGLIQVATRMGTTSSCIDNIFTNYDGNIMVNTVETHISDHLAQIARINLLTSMKPKTEKRLELTRIINKDRISRFKSMLSDVQWE